MSKQDSEEFECDCEDEDSVLIPQINGFLWCQSCETYWYWNFDTLRWETVEDG